MSNISTAPELEFWEFVNCGICHLEFVKDSGGLSSVPFWLTECGHVVCNSHLNADQSCAECGSQGIQLLPLAREMEPPMSNWFLSAPVAFDAVGFALRFQMNTMANLLRHFKKKYIQYRPLYDRLKVEHAETKRLRKMVDNLRRENQQLRRQLQVDLGGNELNENNKRRRLEEDHQYSGHRTSSPRSAASVATPAGPDRLTLPLGHQQPHFNSRQFQHRHGSPVPQQNLAQYAYVPPRSAKAQTMATPTLSHIQSGPSRRVQGDGVAQDNRVMPPPPLPTSRETDTRLTTRLSLSTPLSVPQRPSLLPATTTSQVPSSSGAQRFIPSTPTKTSAAVVSTATPRSFVPQVGTLYRTQQQRFLPSNTHTLPPMSAVSNPASLATNGTISQAVSRSPSMAGTGTARQRTSFVPVIPGGLS